ncbi:MAG TPA: OmpA family protein [Bacteroidales bacterium]|nr:OmpA family protein [Bacteroidales bacterium]
MKKLINILSALFVLSLIVGPKTGLAQNKQLDAAEATFKTGKYTVAVDKYKKAYSKSRKNRAQKAYISFKLGECYRFTNEMRRAEAEYKRSYRGNYHKEDPILLLRFADALRFNEKYDEALEIYDKFLEIKMDDPLALAGKASCTLSKEWLENPTNHQIDNQKLINSREDDFAPTWADNAFNTIIFTSSRDAATGKETDEWTGQNFSDFFITKKDVKGKWSEPVLLEETGIINTGANEGVGAMNKQANNFYFTRCAEASDDGSGWKGCQIYVSKRSGKTFGEPEHVKLAGDSSDANGHPTLSEDELTLIFSSNRKGGKGGKDLWYATRETKTGEFQRPINLGMAVNTEGDEMFPCLRNDSTLYFASNGHPGMGGLDIYISQKKEGKFGTPENIGSPMNTSYDDFGLVFLPGKEEGYFSSNRKGGRGGDDIFYFIEPPLEFTLSGIVKDEQTLQFIENAIVKLTGSDGSSLQARTDPKGFYNFGVAQFKPETTYDIIVSKPNYFNAAAKETTAGVERSKDYVRDFILQPIPEEPVMLPEILYDLAKWDLKPQYQDSLQGLIQTLDANPTLIIELAAHTDARGTSESNDILSQRRAESVVNYLIQRGIDPDRLKAKGYGERAPLKLNKTVTREGITFEKGVTLTEEFIENLPTEKEKEAAHQMNRRTEFSVISKDFVPKSQITPTEETTNITIVENPEQNTVPFTKDERGMVQAECILNGITTQFVYDSRSTSMQISQDKALELLKAGTITKNDFEGNSDELIGDGFIADKAKFTLKSLRIGNTTREAVTVTVNYRLTKPLLMDNQTLSSFGSFRIDEEKGMIIFE